MGAGVDFAAGADGRRSSSAAGRVIVAGALRAADPDGAGRAAGESNWRAGYVTHFRRLIEAGLNSADAAVGIARAGLESADGQLRAVAPDGSETGLDALLTEPAPAPLGTAEVSGTAAPVTELAVPYRGGVLRGDGLARQLDAWVAAGTIEQGCAEAVGAVIRHPEWLSLPGVTVAVLGAGAELGPASTLLGWGGRVLAVDLPRPDIWERLLTAARAGAGTLLIPVARDGGPDDLARRAGADLVSEVPAVADWLAGEAGGTLVAGSYAYADGAGHVRVAAAADVLTRRVMAARGDVALAFLATPTDVFAVPADAVAQSGRAWAGRPAAARLGAGALRMASGGRLLTPAYPAGTDPGVSDSLVTQQGPNYALAKRLQRWRACAARAGGATVSLNVAPPTRTRSVLKNGALRAAYAGAHRFGVEVFDPQTTRVLMAALLVHDLRAGVAPAGHPWQDEARAAAHGGLWRIAYAPRSALTLAAGMGYLSPRR